MQKAIEKQTLGTRGGAPVEEASAHQDQEARGPNILID